MGLSYWHGAALSPSANTEQGCGSCSSLAAHATTVGFAGLRALFRTPERNGTWMAGMTQSITAQSAARSFRQKEV